MKAIAPKQLGNFSPGTHQTGFYLKMEYKIIGVMPDANGIEKPDIYLDKRLLWHKSVWIGLFRSISYINIIYKRILKNNIILK